MTASLPESKRRLLLAAVAAAGVLLLLWLVTGSGSSRRNAASNRPAPGASAEADLRRQLEATLDGLRPERLNVSADARGLVDDLNLWWAEFSQTASLPQAHEQAQTVAKWLGEQAGRRAAASRFDARDVAHVRNGLMYRSIAAAIAAGADRGAVRACDAFELVTRQVALQSMFADAAPIGSFEALLSGLGTPQDRIWVFAEILRQLGIDCVVLEPQEPGSGESAAQSAAQPLVGAIIPGEGVYLFDPGMGLPVCPVEDSEGVLPGRAVTLQQAREDDAVFRQFDVPEGPRYPWSSERLSQIKVRFIVDSACGAPRMLALQSALPQQYAATLFDGPAIAAGESSLEERVIAAGEGGNWEAAQVSVWDYPERQLQAFFAAGGEDSPEMQQRLATLNGPRILRKKIGEGGREQIVEDVSPHPLRVVRVEHLRGELLPALEGYGEIRSAPPQLTGNSEVREDAVYWVGVCQFELQRFDAAANTLKLSLRDYPDGVWSAAARSLVAQCEAERGNWTDAVERVGSLDEPPAVLSRSAFLARRWQRRADGPAEPPPAQ